jgi:two-component system response regulator HydG
MPHALIVEDDPNSLSGLAAILQADGFSVDVAPTLGEARAALTRFIPDVVLIDLNLPDGKGLDLLHYLPQQPPEGMVPVIVMTGNATVESAIEGLRLGIWDYLLKPVSIPRLRSLLARIPRPYELTEEVQALRAELRRLGRFGNMVGRSPATQRIFDEIERIAPTEAAVFISGEPGTGKHAIAMTLHEMSRRKKGPFVTIDGADESLARPFESRMFGHERGAFDLADARETGALEQATGGTLFLNEVTRLPLEQQSHLVSALSRRTFRRMGGSTDVVTDFRLISSTSEHPQAAVEAGRLRRDLYERLNIAPLPVPPLRERSEDIELLAAHFVDRFNDELHVSKRLTPSCIQELITYDWPGNVRELRDRLQRAHLLADGTIETLSDGVNGRSGPGVNGSSVQITVGTPLALVEEILIRATLDAVGGTRHRAASMLGISPKTLYNKLQRMKMT